MKKDIGVVCHEKAILKQKLIKEREDTEIKEKEHSTLLRDILQGQSERSTHEKQRHQLQTDFSESQRKCQELNQKLHENERKLYHSNQELQQKCQDLEKLREDIQEMKGYSDSLEKNIEKSQFRISELEQISLHKQQLIQSLTAEKENALTRLSKMAGNKLSHNNAAIVDLSDPDRPTKLAEKFSEIYDNIWTDAFEDLNAVIGGEDINIISVLLKTLRYVYETAVVDVISYEKSIRRSPLFAPSLYSGMSEADSTAEQTVLEEFYKDLQHQKTVSEMMLSCSKLCSESFSKKMLVLCETQDTEATNAGLALQQSSSKFRIYIVECAKICWLMRLRRPPMHLTFESGEKFDGNIFKQYTKSGERIHYFVWPYLQLHENGPLLAKGVAQPY